VSYDPSTHFTHGAGDRSAKIGHEISWCLAKVYSNGDQPRFMGHVALEGLHFIYSHNVQ